MGRQHLIAVSALYLFFDALLFPCGHAGHHIGQVGWGEQEKMLYAFVMIMRQVINHLVGPK